MTNPTPQQEELVEAVNHLQEVIDRVIPSSTVHYAVEHARTSLRLLKPHAHTVITHDVKSQQ